MKKTVKNMLLLLFITVAVLLPGCGAAENREYVLKINQEAVTKGEFLLYLNEVEQEFEAVGGTDIWDTDFEGQTAQEAAKDRALNSIKMVKLASQRADSYQASLSKEEKEKVASSAEELYFSLSDADKEQITLQETEKTMEDKERYTKVAEKITKDFVPSEADFQAFYQKNRQAYADKLRLYSLSSILIAEEEKAKEAYARAKKGEVFETLVNEYEKDPSAKETGGKMETYQAVLEEQFEKPFVYQAGDITELMRAPEGYYLFRVNAVSEAPERQIEETARKAYTEQMKQRLFLQEYEKWVEKAVIEKNQTVWDSIAVPVES